MIRSTAAIAAVLLLAACKPAPQPSQDTNAGTSAASAPSAPATPAIAPLTPEGWGAIRVGMREPDAVKTIPALKTTAAAHDEDWLACHQLQVDGQPDMYVMIEEEELTRVTVRGANTLKTDKGLGLGATEAQVIAAYGPELKVLPHKYEAAPAHYLTAFDAKTQRGVRYETNNRGLVTAIHVGAGSIELVEGCA